MTVALPEFLLARIAEVEAHHARYAANATPPHDGPHRLWVAECVAKRRIVESVPEPWENGEHAQWDYTLRILAAVYSDHPDYNEAWRA